MINGESETATLIDYGFPQQRALLSYTPRKYQSIDIAIQLDKVIPDQACDAVNEDVKCKAMLLRGRILHCDLRKVGCASQRLPARFLVEDFFSLDMSVSIGFIYPVSVEFQVPARTTLRCISFVLDGLNLPASEV